ncbi:MAG: class I SAM-dependent methyltransferase [Nocardioides sp.]
MHAAALAAAGHRVTLVDPVEAQVLAARQHGTFTAQVGDARRLELDDDTFEAALLLGPLYHLRSPEDRRSCLREAARVVTPGGLVFAAAIPRLARHAAVTLATALPHPYPQEWVDLLEHGTPTPGGRFPAGHFHTAEELEAELVAAGLGNVEVCAIEGVAGLALEQVPDDDPELLGAALTPVRRTGHLPGLRDLSNHLLAVGRVP